MAGIRFFKEIGMRRSCEICVIFMFALTNSIGIHDNIKERNICILSHAIALINQKNKPTIRKVIDTKTLRIIAVSALPFGRLIARLLAVHSFTTRRLTPLGLSLAGPTALGHCFACVVSLHRHRLVAKQLQDCPK